MAPAVSFENVVKAYRSFHALDGLTLSIEQGELYGLLGPNGAGKTTAIRLLTGIQRATSGTVRVLDHAPSDAAVRPLVGYMPQETALYPDLTPAENLDLFGRLYGLDAATRKQRAAQMLEFVELSKWRDTTVANLSGGMKHRASLAAAMLPRPKLLVLDEPTVGVDPELRAQFWERFTHMRETEGTTILLTTHYMDEARRCGRVGFIRQGKLITEGAPADIMRDAGVDNLEDAFLKLTARATLEASP